MNRDANDEFEIFLDEHLAGLTRFATALSLNRQSAEDLAQQTMLRLHLNWSKLRAADNPSAYARRVMINEFLAEARKHRPGVILQTREVGHTDRGLDAIEARAILLPILRRLPSRQRAALVLRYLEDRPDTEIASMIGCTQSTVRSLIKRGLEAIRTHENATAETTKVAR